ncbi:MAG: hypothetical protein ACJ8GN_01185 [Longimicrobiaceae bacterium]
MKKLRMDTLKVDSFPTTDGIDATRGTVAGYAYATPRCDTLADCPYSYGGTCVISCNPCTRAEAA